ncbi:MAG: right-handed parallel beta-helix repeat-containing protein [Planctomycetes bacterium]|nr:right-handed parallel beta-helix repeat-containing protein [Planctomycetota bacterium]
MSRLLLAVRATVVAALSLTLVGPGSAAESGTVAPAAPAVEAAPASVTTVYASPDGDDGAVGSAELPVRSLRRALALVPPGGRVSLASGTWREGRLTMERGGSPESPLVIEGAGIGKTIITGAVPVTGWQSAGGKVWKVEGWSTNCQQLSVDGVMLAQIGARSPWHTKVLWANKVCLPPRGKGVGDLAPGSFYHDGDAQTLYCQLADGSDPNSHSLEASSQDFLINGGSTRHVTLRGLALTRSNGTVSGDRSTLLRLGASHWTVEDCEISHGDFVGIGITGEHHVVRRCSVVGNGNTGIDMNGSDAAHGYRWFADRAPMHVLVEDCAISRNNARDFFNDWHAGGMKCIPACRAVTVRRCEVRDNRGAGIWFDSCLGDILIEDNLVVGNDTGIFYEISAPAVGDGYGALIRNNRVVGSKHQGIYVSASQGARVEGNTLFSNWANLVIHGMPREQHQLKGNSARNNVLGSAKLADLILFAGKDAADNVVEGNFYARRSGKSEDQTPRIGVVKGTGYDITHRDLVKLAKDVGCEREGRCGDPLWRNADKHDFFMRNDSPARDKGWHPPKAAKP